MIREPVKLPTNVKRPLGHPFILPEMLWAPPDLYQSEGPLMVAAQTCADRHGHLGLVRHGQPVVRQSVVTSGSGNTPMILGQFPAAALIFRQGLVEAGKPAVVEHRRLEDLWDRKTPIISEESGWDPNRDTGNIVLTSSVKTAARSAGLPGRRRCAWSTTATRPRPRSWTWPSTSTGRTRPSAASPARSRPTTAGASTASTRPRPRPWPAS